MTSLVARLRRAWPRAPRRRYCVFAGSNVAKECWLALRALVQRHDDAEAITEFERQSAEAADCRHAFSVGAGRMGLYAILGCLGIRPGAEIIIPAFTCVVVANAIIYRGFRPVYADIDPVTFNLDIDHAETLVGSATAAVYLQHTFGVTADVEKTRAFAERHGLVVIEDLAHSLGASHDGHKHGALGDVAFMSVDRTKVISTQLGGVITTNDDTLAEALAEELADTPHVSPWFARRIMVSFIADYVFNGPYGRWLSHPALAALSRLGLHVMWRDELSMTRPSNPPFPCRLTAGQARIGSSQLSRLETNLEHRRHVARWLEDRIGWYGERLAGRFDEQAWLRYSFLVEDRDELVRRASRHIDLDVWFTSPLSMRNHDLEAVGYVEGSCPVAERTVRHIANLPTHPRIPLAAIKRFWQEHGDWISDHAIRPAARSGSTGEPGPK